MAIPLYLAITAAEFRRVSAPPRHTAWLSCLFSPYSTGLSNLPKQLPPGSLLILSDRTPICGHDPGLIRAQLADIVSRLGCSGVLLDFQRPGCETAAEIAGELAGLPCPVAVSELYAQGLTCPVFLPPVPPDVALQEYIAPWQGREVWLEAALGGSVITVTEQGSTFAPLPPGEMPDFPFVDESLHCHYRIEATPQHIRFTLRRSSQELDALLDEAEDLGVTQAVGLYQELNDRSNSATKAYVP